MRNRGKTVAVLLASFAWGLSGLVADAEVARTLDEVKALNPAVAEAYAPLHEERVPQMGVHWGVPGPSVMLAVGADRVVAAYEIMVPEAAGWFPWFDQPEGEPMVHPQLGRVYTQHIYVTDRASVNEGQTPVAIGMNWAELVAANPKIADYSAISGWVPGMGYHYGPPAAGPALLVMVGHDGEVFGFEIIQPADQGWHPWFDQAEGEPMMFPFGPAYTQHVYIVPMAHIADE